VNKKELTSETMNSFVTLQLISILSVLPSSLSYCFWAGQNPSWKGPPKVEQLTLTSVRVSWAGLLESQECADSIIVKHYKGDFTSDFFMSDPLDVGTNSYIVRDIVPLQPYTYQVIAREEKGFRGVDYNRSEKKKFTTKKANNEVNKDDPLPTVKNNDDSETVEHYAEEESGELKPVYNQDVKIDRGPKLNPEANDNAILGMRLEVFMGIVIGSLIVGIVAVGIIYNCVRKKPSDKDIELEFESEEEEESSDEEDEEEFEEGKEVKKYDMMISSAKNDATAPILEHSLSSPP